MSTSKSTSKAGRWLVIAVVAVLVIRNPAGTLAAAHHVITALAHAGHSAAHLTHRLRTPRSHR